MRPRPPIPEAQERPRQADHRRTRGEVGGECGSRTGTYRVRSHRDPGPRSSRSTPRRPPHRVRSTSGTCSATPTPTSSPATSGWRDARSSTRWVGTTTACRPSGGSRTSTASAATRPSPTSPTSPRPSRRPRSGPTTCAVSRPNFIELCLELLAVDEAAFETDLAAGRVCRSTGRLTYTTVGERSRRASPARLPAQPGPGRGVLPGRAEPLGRHVPDRRRPGRARGPRAPGRVPPPRLPPRRRHRPADRHHPPGARRQLRRGRRPSRRRAVHATWSAPPSRRRSSGSPSRCTPTRSPSPTRARASRWSAPSATSPTSSGGASSTFRPAPSSNATAASRPMLRSGCPTRRPRERYAAHGPQGRRRCPQPDGRDADRDG